MASRAVNCARSILQRRSHPNAADQLRERENMNRDRICPHCGHRDECDEELPSVAFACSAVDGGTSECVAPAEVRSVAAGRQVTNLASMSWLELTRLQDAVTNEVLRRITEPK